jgi:glycogen(starch) synthase
MVETPKADILFEISWEVCNKVGGIYTVVRSKIPFIQQHYKEYITIGPALEHQPEFDPKPIPAEWEEVFQELEKKGVFCQYGVWLAPGKPTAILIDSRNLVTKKDELKFWYWEHHRIDSLRSTWEFEEPMCFATAAGMLIEEYARRQEDAPQQKRIVCQCHEWITGFALLHLKGHGANVGTVFTTHATMLGRTIAGSGHELYEMLDSINPSEWAYKYNVQDKHLTEVACAHTADVFTTVSEITGIEAERLLGRKPDVLLYNGFYTEKFPTFEETSIKHYQSRETLREFLAYQFFPHYAFDIEKTIICFTSGRYEFHNKGMDVLVDALARLNHRLKEENSDTTIIMFFWVIMGHGNLRFDVLENKNTYNELKFLVEWQSKQLLQKITLDFLTGHTPGEGDLFTSSFVKSLREEIGHSKREGDPPLVTHDINWDTDQIISSCRAQGLLNRREDRVKIMLYPGYLDGTDGLLNLQYYDATVGAHLGIFPSSYEPWGYTPLESAMLGVPAITTDLAGFGRYMANIEHTKGIFVLNRFKRSRDEVIAELAEKIYSYAMLDRNERVQQGFAAKSLSTNCDWKQFIRHYITAHNMALK